MINRLFFLYNLATILVFLSLAGQTLTRGGESLAGETRYFYHNHATKELLQRQMQTSPLLMLVYRLY